MDKIYSRKRIKIIKPKNSDNNKNNKMLTIICLLIISVITTNSIIKAITPVINKNCSNIAKSIANKISNEQSTIVMNKYKYEDLCLITKDNNGNVTMISANIIPINEIISEITINIQEEFDKIQYEKFNIKLGAFTGSKILSGRGPNVEIRISTIGNLSTDLKSEFYSVGINQTLHKIYLEIECNVIILTPFTTQEEKIKNQILLAESVILGTIPNTYYNFQTDSQEILTQMVN